MIYLAFDSTVLGDLIFPAEGNITVTVETIPSLDSRDDHYWQEIVSAANQGELIVVYDKYAYLGRGRQMAAAGDEYYSLLQRMRTGFDKEIEQCLQQLARKGVFVCRDDLCTPVLFKRPDFRRLRYPEGLHEATIHPDPSDKWKDCVFSAENKQIVAKPGELQWYPRADDIIFQLEFCYSSPLEDEENEPEEVLGEETDDEGALLKSLRSGLSSLATPWKQVVSMVEICKIFRIN